MVLIGCHCILFNRNPHIVLKNYYKGNRTVYSLDINIIIDGIVLAYASQ